MGVLQRWAEIDDQAGALGRYSVLFLSLAFLLITLPIFGLVDGGALRFTVLFHLVLGAAVYVNSTERWSLVVAGILGVGSMLGGVAASATGSLPAKIASDAVGLGLLGFTTLLMLNALARTRKVSGDTVVGGVCVYLLIGLSFAMSYMLLTDLDPGALLELGVSFAGVGSDLSSRATTIIYFSFVTLTTLGYGDITPVGEMARMLVSAEAVIGQLFVAIFIARLIAQRSD